MKVQDFAEPRVMAMALQNRRIGFALFEGMHEPIEWGIRKFESDGEGFDEARTLLGMDFPSVLILPATDTRYSRLPRNVHEMVDRIADTAEKSQIEVVRFTREDIRAYFSTHDAATKEEIAEAVGKIIPEFARCVPSPRNTGDGEQHSMLLFDALSLIVTFYKTERQQPES